MGAKPRSGGGKGKGKGGKRSSGSSFSDLAGLTKPAIVAAFEQDLTFSRYIDLLGASPTLTAFVNELLPEGEDTLYALAQLLDRVLGAAPRLPHRMRDLEIESEGLRIVPGDLHVAGDVENGGVFIVLGNAALDGLYWDRDVGNLLIATGDVTGHSANVFGGAVIGGGWRLRQAFYGVDHNWSVSVAEALVAPLVVLEDKAVRTPRIEAQLLLDTRELNEALIERARNMLAPGLVRAPGMEPPVDFEAIAQRLALKQPLFAGSGSSSTGAAS